MVMSVFMTVSLSLDRYLSVVHPLLAIQNHWVSSCKFLATPSFLFALLFTLPNYFLLTTEHQPKTTEPADLLGNTSVPEIPQNCGSRLVWATWRHDKAFTTVRYTPSSFSTHSHSITRFMFSGCTCFLWPFSPCACLSGSTTAFTRHSLHALASSADQVMSFYGGGSYAMLEFLSPLFCSSWFVISPN